MRASASPCFTSFAYPHTPKNIHRDEEFEGWWREQLAWVIAVLLEVFGPDWTWIFLWCSARGKVKQLVDRKVITHGTYYRRRQEFALVLLLLWKIILVKKRGMK